MLEFKKYTFHLGGRLVQQHYQTCLLVKVKPGMKFPKPLETTIHGLG
jgi:hypothetical protein